MLLGRAVSRVALNATLQGGDDLMPAKSAMNVSLTPELTQFVSERVATGQYRTASEVVRAALRLLKQQEPQVAGPKNVTVEVDDSHAR
jgi:antitoxin ParD1/3/4